MIELNILQNFRAHKDIKKNNIIYKKFEKLEIISNKNSLSILQKLSKQIKQIPKINLVISSNICEFNIFKPKKHPFSLISSKASELILIHNINHLIKEKNLNKREKDKINYFKSKTNEIYLEGINKEQHLKKINAKLKIESNINNYNITIEKKKTIKAKNIIANIDKINIQFSKKISFHDLNKTSKVSEIIILKQNKILNFKKLSISYLINQIFIEKRKIIKKFSNIEISHNIEEFHIKKFIKEFKISFQINEINILPDEKVKKLSYIKKLSIVSKISDINIINSSKHNIFEISSKISELIIKKTKRKYMILYMEKKELNFIMNKNKKKDKRNKETEIQKVIIDNYINSINLGFDNNNSYEDYNKINKEKDDDSDNENDKLECEPVPSFILCIQKKNK